MAESVELSYGNPVYGEDLDKVVDEILKDCETYNSKEVIDREIVKEDFGVGLYWEYEDVERFVFVTAYDDNRAYLSVGAKNRDNQEEIIEIGFVSLEDLEPHLEAAGSTAEDMDAPL